MFRNAQRFGSVMEVTYQCNECYTGEGSATCRNGQWTHDGSCDSKHRSNLNFRCFSRKPVH